MSTTVRVTFFLLSNVPQYNACMLCIGQGSILNMKALQIGKIFACASNTRGHARYAWNRLLKDCKSDSERADRQAELDASQKALHHHTGLEVSSLPRHG